MELNDLVTLERGHLNWFQYPNHNIGTYLGRGAWVLKQSLLKFHLQNLDEESTSKSQPNINISNKKLQNLDQTFFWQDGIAPTVASESRPIFFHISSFQNVQIVLKSFDVLLINSRIKLQFIYSE